MSRHISQPVCPLNVRFAQVPADNAAFAPLEALAGRDARALEREMFGMTRKGFSVAFKASTMKRAKLRGLKRDAAVVWGSVGTAEDVDVLTCALEDEEPLVREHAAWALARIADRLHASVSRSSPSSQDPDTHTEATR